MFTAPFDGVRILDLSAVWAAPYAAQFLTANGAEVIKIEHPARPDFRLFGPFADGEPGERFWERSGTFNLLHRHKKSATLDLSSDEGVALFRELVKISDVVVENYTPRVMKQFGLDYESLRNIRPDLIMLSLTGYGHTGPWRNYLATGDSMEPTCGFCEVTGYTDGAPMKAGFAYVDLIASWYCAFALAGALEQRERTGSGQWLDVSMYECGVSFLGDALLAYEASGFEPSRIGNDHPWAAPHGCYQCSGEDRWIAISVYTDEQWQALCTIVGQPALADSPKFAQSSQRWQNREELRPILEAWTKERDAREAMETLQTAGVPASLVFNNRDLLTDPHLASRGFYEAVRHPERTGLGTRLYPRLPFRFIGEQVTDNLPAPDVGEHNAEVFSELLGHDWTTINSLYSSGVLGDKPVGVPLPFKATSLEELLGYKQLARVDADYQERLLAAHPELEEAD